MVYDLSRLGSNRFEHLVQALTLAHLGHGVSIFGAGPDGGREATFHGEVDMRGKDTWNGYGVIQAKYKERLTTTAADQSWFFQQVTAELDAWINPKKKRYLKKPQYFIIATNVPLTAVAHSGGLDRLQALFERYRDMVDDPHSRKPRKIGLPNFKDYAVWHAEYLDRLLETHGEIRRSYADLILPGDVISRLYEQIEDSDRRLAQAWIGHVTRALKNDDAVELGESGDSNNTPLPLEKVAVDLPASFEDRPPTPSLALKILVDRGDQVLSPALKPAVSDRVVVLGGPGSGKSTLSRLLCQLYRVSLLRGVAAAKVTRQVTERSAQIRAAFDDASLPDPTLHRLPVRVVLSKFADAVNASRKLTLLQYIVDLINDRGSDPISVPDIKRILAAWPLLVVLDGMDEVASARNRDEVSTRISDFLSEMAALEADVFAVCTSRPLGFERDPEVDYEELHLTPLQPHDAMHFASRLLACRFSENADRREETLERLRAASQSSDTARLMTSPLQVTILSLLLEQRRKAPASRYLLFKSYYDAIYARECTKPEGIGDVLEAYRPQFDQLHEQCGLAIHARAEVAGAAEAILPVGELELIARNILESEGHPESDREALIRRVLHLAQQRLVLLVARMDGVAFEVRSLAEFFAARCLMADENAPDKLEIMVPSVHWRNTWLLAAGLIFSERLYWRDAVLGRLNAADHSSAVNRLVMPGALLAIDALQDGFAANAPKFEQNLVQEALRLVTGPTGKHILKLAIALVPFMERSAEVDRIVWREVEALLADRNPGATRAFLNALGASDSETIATRATNMLADYDEQHGLRPAADVPDDESELATILAKLADTGVFEGTLVMEDIDDQMMIDIISRASSDGDPSDSALLEAREILVAHYRDNYSSRSRMRANLAAAIEHDRIGPVLCSEPAGG
ncbi:NACHT domain-containing protein [Nocardia wallacei]|uniref:NACHT domain-containing protein n=1 Tax=Nocardia wallacei TaxID=480035 RepID=UPI002458EE85|nr:hypothetical protein [Nocardia wallacei]